MILRMTLIASLLAALVAASPSPSPSPTPSGPSDPCGSILSIVTRPTVTTSVCTARTGHVVIETGYTNTSTTGTGGGQTVEYPQTFLRVGTGDPHLEFSLTPPTSVSTSVGGALTGGTADTNAGVKYELGYTDKAVWGVNGQISFPTGSRAFTAGSSQYTGNFNWGYTLSPEFSLAGTLGFNALAGYDANGAVQHYFAFVPSVELEATLPANSQLFAEYAYFSQAGVGLGSRSFLDFGYQKDLSAHIQIDLEYGVQPTLLLGQRVHSIGGGIAFMN